MVYVCVEIERNTHTQTTICIKLIFFSLEMIVSPEPDSKTDETNVIVRCMCAYACIVCCLSLHVIVNCITRLSTAVVVVVVLVFFIRMYIYFKWQQDFSRQE